MPPRINSHIANLLTNPAIMRALNWKQVRARVCECIEAFGPLDQLAPPTAV